MLLKKYILPNLCALLFIAILPNSVHGQSDTRINLSIGAMGTIAPSLTFDDEGGSAAMVSIFGDLQINKKIIGRAQYSSLIPSTFEDDHSQNVESMYSLIGSLGYVFLTDSPLGIEVPVMISAGYVSLTYRNAFQHEFTEEGMQAGITISPQYRLTERLSVSSALRYLTGVQVNEGVIAKQLDLSIGLRYTFI